MSHTVSIDVFLDRIRGRIDPNLYGLHVEHIWNCVYPAIWVGRDSPIPNIDGIRKDLVEHLAALRPPVCKYPGGYFTDLYDWRDGVGPAHERPVRVCPTEPGREESNQFGTAEFARFCGLIGAEPYLSVNATFLDPRSASQWIEYCNLNGNTEWAARRRAHGFPRPFGVKYWAIGNEQYWLHSAEQYAERYRHWAHFMYNTDPRITLVASGIEPVAGLACDPWNADGTWGERFLRLTRSCQAMFSGDWHPKPDEREILYSIHPYFSANADCTREEYYAAFAELSKRLPRSIAAVVELLDRYRGAYRRPRLCFDEYGLLHPDSHWSMAGNMTQAAQFWSALWLACFFQICHEHPQEIGMANLPGTVNMEHALLLAEGDKTIATPSYHLFRLYRDHGGSDSLVTEVKGAPDLPGSDRGCLWALASRKPGAGKALLSVVNVSLEEALAAQIVIHGGRAVTAEGEVLAAADIHSSNTFASAGRIVPAAVKARVAGGKISHEFPPHSVTVFTVELQ